MLGRKLKGGRAAKRARVEELDLEPAAAAAAPPEASGAFDALPDALMGEVFKTLGLRESWPLRGVCRRWRRVVEETQWASLELRVKDASCGPGSSVAITIERASQQAAEVTCSVLKLAAATQPREVAVKLLKGSTSVANDEGPADFDEHFLRGLELGVLRALRPPKKAASRLESLSVCLDPDSEEGEWGGWPSASAAELRAALAPFGASALRSLGIFVDDSEAAAAVAAACPLLRSVRLQPKQVSDGGGSWEAGASDVMAALAPLAHLEELVIEYPDRYIGDGWTRGLDISDGLVALADGAAGKTLRTISFPSERGLVKNDALRALQRLPNLESISWLRICVYPGMYSSEGVQAGGILAIGRVTRLRSVGLIVDLGDPPVLQALTVALSALPRLESLGLELDDVYKDALQGVGGGGWAMGVGGSGAFGEANC
eukprot:tig00020693_g13042.t1